MDWPRMPPGQTAASICSKFSSESISSPCISLKPFLEPSDHLYVDPREGVTAPCKGDPCDSNQVCLVNRNCVRGKSCQPFLCVTGIVDNMINFHAQ